MKFIFALAGLVGLVALGILIDRSAKAKLAWGAEPLNPEWERLVRDVSDPRLQNLSTRELAEELEIGHMLDEMRRGAPEFHSSLAENMIREQNFKDLLLRYRKLESLLKSAVVTDPTSVSKYAKVLREIDEVAKDMAGMMEDYKFMNEDYAEEVWEAIDEEFPSLGKRIRQALPGVRASRRAAERAARLGAQTVAARQWWAKCGRLARVGGVNLVKILAFIDPLYRDADERLLIALDEAYNVAHPGEHSLVGKYMSSWLAKKLPADVEPVFLYQLDFLLIGGTPSVSETIKWEEFKSLLKELGNPKILPLNARRKLWMALEVDWGYLIQQYPKGEMKEWLNDYLDALRTNVKLEERREK